MNYHNISDSDLVKIHNRSKKRYDEFCASIRRINEREQEERQRPIRIPNGGSYIGLLQSKKFSDDELDVDNIDYAICKSIIVFDETLKYLCGDSKTD